MDRFFLLVVALVVILALRFFARRFFVQIGTKAIARQPDALHLKRSATPAWRNPAAVDAITQTLLARGFTDGGTFTAPEMPAVIIRMFAKPAEAVCSCIYEHEKVGVWMDMFTRYQDTTGITFTNTRDRGLSQRPGRPILHFPELSPADLYQQFIAERPAGAMVTITAEQLPRFYEEAYAESMAWRKNKGITAEEVARVAKTREET